MSPTSILDTKNSPNFVNPFGYEQQNLPKFPEINAQNPPQAIGLALIDSLTDEKTDVKFSKPINRMVLFGSKLKVQIPAINPISPVESPKSPADFGIKTKNSQLLLSPLPETPSKDFSRQLSLKEMELSEDYTCVITHGPNPKTTHIFDNCIVECCCGEDMIKSCGEKAFCNHECQCQEMDFDGKKNPVLDDTF
ncbi:hypothetical protein DH2020_031212 [Rehmannia glutinosa]|uniref:Uncharacterized protein n=1 Tax=Rehmannia glutinosa TaxID=99300 RepID=A0ABR0VM45_REHGL